jgi:glycosyltransferase involved in cell wall biosynthesis
MKPCAFGIAGNISFLVPGILEATDIAVIDDECGPVAPPRDPQRLGNAILTLAHDASMRLRFGEAARNRIYSRFTLEKCVNCYDAFYSGLQAGILPGNIDAIHPPA